MKNEVQDKLAVKRAKFVEEITDHESSINRLRAKIELLDEIIADEPKTSNGSSAAPAKYSGLKLTKAILDAMSIIGTNGGIGASEIRKYIAANGYRHPNPKNFGVAVVICLSRLAENERINSTKTDGKRLYSMKK